MLYAVRGNKQLKIDEADKTAYLKLGYDIAEEKDGSLEIVENAPTKTVAFAEHKKVLDENAELKAQLAEAKPTAKQAELKAEIESLKTQLADAQEKLKAATGG